MHTMNALAQILGWIVMAAGGIALVAFIVFCAVDFAATRYAVGHNIIEVVMAIRNEKRARREAAPSKPASPDATI